ncbi:MAG TPA: hypothetical protein VMM60_18005 [Ilumatobacter sp.]|nr:hypothetical protein [Ilumatobacter sp.]
MDISKFKTHDWLVIGGAAIFLIFGFMSWISVEVQGGGISVSSGAGNVFDFFWTGTIPWILVMASAVVTVLVVQGTLSKDQAPWPLIILAATGLAALLLIIRLVFNPLDDGGLGGFGGIEYKRGIGMILSAVGGIVAAAGGVMGFTASGGSMSDLTDMNKMKAAFDKGDGNPGPADGGSNMPPPPPPM